MKLSGGLCRFQCTKDIRWLFTWLCILRMANVFILMKQMYWKSSTPTSDYVDRFFKLCETDTFAINLLYSDVPQWIIFLDAPVGTGKTFVVSLILATIRSEQKIALALASSGIAATLLEGGRTAHSALKLPLNVQVIETPTCNISRNSAMAKVLRLTSIILWDECTMANKKSLEAFNRTMQDLRGNQQLFGGALILLSGDFRQTLPVIPRSTPADEINACLKSSVFGDMYEN
ncbi:ATP-dependent DNA helicase pif1 [Eumeta japonica]|uniref:ATP-dependent DNA helicase n=1 Tax=Eumeta variegata TaxID=151549 RepID=A0A4C1UZX7_EUMVA|nr:ATP-dependent DNA helicase pif1 [Eumeta japonica]